MSGSQDGVNLGRCVDRGSVGSRVSKTLSLTLGLPLKCRVILGSLGRGSVGSRGQNKGSIQGLIDIP